MDVGSFIRPEEACRMLQVVPGTLRSWAKQGKLRYVTTKGGHRRYELQSVLGLKDESIPESKSELKPRERKRFCYARVSTYSQKKDLETQLEYFKTAFPNHTCIKDLGSGLNFKRKGFLSILDCAIRGDLEEVVVTHKDRLCRFGYEIIERILQQKGGRIVVLHQENLTPEQELVQDLLTITTVFSARLYGLRSHSLKRQIRNASKKTKAQQDWKGIQDITPASVSDGE